MPGTLPVYRGALATGLRSYPLNLLWVMPAKGGVMRSCFVFTRVVESGVPLAPGALTPRGIGAIGAARCALHVTRERT